MATIEKMPDADVRKGMPDRNLDRASFERRYLSGFADPVFDPLQADLHAIVDAAWDAHANGRKSAHTRNTGAGFVDRPMR
jgi:hypothetical protein